jgi:alpha-D-ribose 1-methylphosphonate 5-triphosphate synthase subunit PhnH
MLSPPLPDAAETRANAAFDAILWALSRPGLPRRLPASGEGILIEALLDSECQVYTGDPLLVPVIGQTGARLVDIALADHVFLGKLSDLVQLGQCRMGSDLYPDDGATVVLRARFGTGARLRLTGPGVKGAVEVQIGGMPDGVWTRRAELMRYPMGFDLLVLDGDQIIGLPRSTNIEVL